MFNVAKEPWNNVKVRQAVMYALDTEKMVSNTFAGLATAASCYLPKSFTNYQGGFHGVQDRRQKAKKLIEESGVTRVRPSPCAPPTTSRLRAWPPRSRTTSTLSASM